MSAPVEPSADVREVASLMRQFYVALIAEGFTPAQTIRLLLASLRHVVRYEP